MTVDGGRAGGPGWYAEPNKGMEPTAYSARSCVAPASSISSCPALGHLRAALFCALYYQLKNVARLS